MKITLNLRSENQTLVLFIEGGGGLDGLIEQKRGLDEFYEH